MSDTEVMLTVTIVGGFVVLLLTLAAFIKNAYRAGVAGLVVAGAAFILALVLMSHVSAEQDEATRTAVLEKYDVKIQAWGNPLGTAAEWKVNGKEVECEVDLQDPADPVVKCEKKELPLR
jgi:hypothetical protein